MLTFILFYFQKLIEMMRIRDFVSIPQANGCQNQICARYMSKPKIFQFLFFQVVSVSPLPDVFICVSYINIRSGK